MSDYTDALLWHKERHRKGAGLQMPVRGFGPDGSFTLWLASSQTNSGWSFVNGRPQLTTQPSCLDNPDIRARRDELIGAMEVAGPTFISISDVGLPLYRYAAALIHLSYTAPGGEAPLSDEDLTFILSGTKWYEPIVRHALGGDDMVARLGLFASRKQHAAEQLSHHSFEPVIEPEFLSAPEEAESLSARALKFVQRFFRRG